MSEEKKTVKDEELENVVGGGKGGKPNNGGNNTDVPGKNIYAPAEQIKEEIAPEAVLPRISSSNEDIVGTGIVRDV